MLAGLLPAESLPACPPGMVCLSQQEKHDQDQTVAMVSGL